MARRQHGGRPSGADAQDTDRFARRLCNEAAALTSALEAELWASGLLGVLWSHRFCAALRDAGSAERDCIRGGHLLDAIADTGGLGARVALIAIERLDDGEPGVRAGKLLGALTDLRSGMPSWVSGVGAAEVQRAAVMREEIFDDGFTIFIEACHPNGERHAIGTYIDNNLGVMAKDILLAESIDQVRAIMLGHPPHHGELRLDPLEPGVAAGRVRAAMKLTDMTLDAPLGKDYARLRALALRRADEAPGYRPVSKPECISGAARDRLWEEFLRSPEGLELAADGDAALVASLAIDFCADCIDGRPLRWSPGVVELFMIDWIPCMAAPELFGAVPAALDAWIRFAGRKARMPAWAIEAVRESVPRWGAAMTGGPADRGPSAQAQQFLRFAKRASVDGGGVEALGTFIAHLDRTQQRFAS